MLFSYHCFIWSLFEISGNKDMVSAVHHIPSEYVDLEPGDVLFNPPWQWHKITSELNVALN